jgi:integrase
VFPHLKEATPRKGFVEDGQYRDLTKHTRELWLRALAVAYTFGFRKGELLRMRCSQVNLGGQTIRLHRGETKSGEPRLIKMTREVLILLTACLQGKGQNDYVFTRKNSALIRDFRGAWETLCAAAGVPYLPFHDLRRSAVRNIIRRGVPERVAMAIGGHKTRAIFDRYNIVSEADLAEAARKIEAGMENGYNLVTVPTSGNLRSQGTA